MLGKVLTEALADLEQIRLLIGGFRSLRERDASHGPDMDFVIFDGVSAGQLKLFEYCTSIIRTYTIFERLVYALAEGWIGWVLKHNAASILANPTCRSAFETGVAEIFRRQTEPRFSDIDRFSLSKSHSLFDPKLASQQPYELAIIPFLATLPNLRIEHICSLFSNVALGSPAQWLEDSPQLISLRDEYSLGHLETLKEIVLRRNEVAHGNPDPGQFLGTNELLARIEIISALAISLHQFLLVTASELELGKNFEKGLIGEITHCWPKNRAVELTMSCSVLVVGEKILVVEKAECFASYIESIQIEGQNTTGFSGSCGTQLGIKMGRTPRQGARLLRASAIREFDSLLS